MNTRKDYAPATSPLRGIVVALAISLPLWGGAIAAAVLLVLVPAPGMTHAEHGPSVCVTTGGCFAHSSVDLSGVVDARPTVPSFHAKGQRPFVGRCSDICQGA